MRQSVEAYWQHVRHPMFVAFFELAVAARTDKELADDPASPRRRASSASGTRPRSSCSRSGKARGEKFELGFDLSRYVMEGMAISFLTHKETERDKRVLSYLEEKIRELAGLPKAAPCTPSHK